MGLSVKEQFQWWGVILLVFGLLLWILGATILPFVMGAAIAYFLDPLADRLEAMGLSRVLSVLVITFISALALILMLVLVIPSLITQVAQLFQAAPAYFDSLISFLKLKFPALSEEGSAAQDLLATIGAQLKSKGGTLATAILNSSLAVIDFVIFIVFTPVVAFYLLLDWDDIVATIDGWLPREHQNVIRQILGDINQALAGFVRGQLSVCMILGGFYSIALMIAGLQFGLVVGIFAGIISFIPFVGSSLGGALAIGLALFQFWGDPVQILIIGAIFVAGQVLEGNFLTPKLVGGSVGLHPVWLMFALSAFGALFGLTGMLVAVPVAAAIGVVTRFILSQYLESKLYKGAERKEE